ncbi:MAG: VWA domain-containing protein [Elusimicrobiales bacterium]|nr:VWA domain-containing protein [Elusimicrobiales bacterium]
MELFSHPLTVAWGLLGVAAAVAAHLFSRARRAALLAALGRTQTLARLIPGEAAARRALKAWLFISALAAAFIALAGPQWGVEFSQSAAGAGQLVVAVDTSWSMLARDVKPSRMENAKLMLKLLIDQTGGYRMGIIAFSGQAYVQCPLTTDPDALKYFLSSVRAGMLPQPGTSLASAVSLADSMLGRYPGKKALILLTDGEDLSGGLKDSVKKAAEAGVAIIAVGIGKPEGEPIPADGGAGAAEYRKDREGRTVVSRLGEKTLLDMAAATGGAYIRYNNPDSVAGEISSQLKKLEKSKWQGKSRVRYKNRYQLPLALALLLLLLELLVPETGEMSLRKIAGFEGFARRRRSPR